MPNQRSRLSYGLLVFVLVIGTAVFLALMVRGLEVNPNKVPSALIGQQAMDFNVKLMQGEEFFGPQLNQLKTISLQMLRGRPLILNFWASWCTSCRDEATELEAFWRKHQTEGILLVGVAIQDSEDEARKFAKILGKSYILALDTDGRIAIDYGVYGVPETFLIDRTGIIRYKEAGNIDLAKLEKLLPSIMRRATQ